MSLIRDNPAARSLPSRHRYALARLLALLTFRDSRTMPDQIDRLVLSIDRDQNAIEICAVSAWMFVTAAWYLAEILPLPFGWAVAVALAFGGIVIQFPLYFVGGVLVPLWNLAAGTKTENNQNLNSIVSMTLMFAASVYFGITRSSARYPAWFFLAVFILNAGAWVILLPWRGRMREMERRCGL